MLKRCVICGKKMNLDTGHCTGNKCPFKDPSKELQKQFEEKQNEGAARDLK